MALIPRKWRRELPRKFAIFLSWIGAISGALPILSLLLKPISFMPPIPFEFIIKYWLYFYLVTLSAITIGVIIWISLLQRRFVMRFKDNFKKPLNLNWDYEGAWHVREEGELVVTDSEAGGITKIGALWENYTFTFKAKILHDCIGVIVRAQDLSNYYMFQIRQDRVRPHRRVALPVQSPSSPPPSLSPQSQPAPTRVQIISVPYVVVWQPMDDIATSLPKPLIDWFTVEVTVRGESVQILIDGELVFEREALLKNPLGKVGFRNAGAEQALVRRVRLLVQG